MSRLVLKDQTVPRLSPSLAKEIGLHESILLLQIEFWLQVMGTVIDGRVWVRQTHKQIKKQLPFLSKGRIHRVINNLIEMNLIDVSDEFNEWPRDKTNWFSLNDGGCEQLESVKLIRVKGSGFGATLPENYYSNNSLKIAGVSTNVRSETSDDVHGDFFSDPDEEFDVPNEPSSYQQNSLFDAKRKSKTYAPGSIERVHHQMMYNLCYGIEDSRQSAILNSTQRGRVANALATLAEAGADLDEIKNFNKWWVTHWQSKSQTGGSQNPRPDQVVEHWWVAMKYLQPKPEPKVKQEAQYDDKLELKLRERAISRRGK